MTLRGLYNIPAGTPFAPSLAAGLYASMRGDQARLSACRILLPTRRACRTLRDAFLNLTDGKPLLLPRMQPLGDIDQEELEIELAGRESAAAALTLPPALPPLRRQIMLARAVMELPDFASGPDQAFALAAALGRLMDQIYTEDRDLRRLPELVTDQDLARHWQITVKFLEILSHRWPEILEEHGVIDAADRRNRLIKTLALHWQDNPPAGPVIAAGSTGSIPATALLLKTIATLPQGAVVLPGLDTLIDRESWDALDASHPQATLRQLLNSMERTRDDVQNWPFTPAEDTNAADPPALAVRKRKARNWLASEMMRPAATAERWQSLNLDSDLRTDLDGTLRDLLRYECETPEDEALLIATIMRETLIVPGRTAAIITPDRTLARRISTACQRWGITLDDSGGQPLPETPTGSFLRLIIQAALSGCRPGPLTALLRHRLTHIGRGKKDIAELINRLETDILRGTITGSGFAALYAHAARKERDEGRTLDLTFLQELEILFDDLTTLIDSGEARFADFLTTHIRLAETLAATPDKSGADNLWIEQDGEQAALFLSSLRDQAAYMPPVSGESYAAILEQLMRTINVRATWGTHPRLYIYGQLEARLIQEDITVLAGLNEKSWPPDPGSDPWMSRPMRRDFRLPAPERAIGLAAHDYVQGFNAGKVVLTRSLRDNGTPTVPARWLQRLDTVLTAIGLDPAEYIQTHYQDWTRILDRPSGDTEPAKRPQPRPPVESRPDALYVTAIEQWMRDPYSIYAKYILGLRKLALLEEQADAAERGNILHETLNRFVRDYPDTLPPGAPQILLQIGREELGDKLEDPRLWGFWWPRFERLADWFIAHEQDWRASAINEATEARGETVLDVDGFNFTLRARADRIDRMRDGTLAVIDYKTGGAPSTKEAEAGYSPQLPLEAIILQEGGFPGVDAADVTYMGFWKLSGAAEPGEEKPLKTDPEIARQGLIRLIRTFRDPATPYISLPRPDKAPPVAWQDYAHLARVQEWAALEDSEGEAA